MDHSKSPWWQVFVDAIDKLPPAQQPARLAGLAMQMKARGERSAAAMQALRAWRLARAIGASEDAEIVSQALSAFTSRYHVQISTDPVRIAAWQAAFSEILRPDMLALEIGAGSGILAMLAARTGADVVSCEKDLILAAIAEETVRHNGLADRIRIIGKPVEELGIPGDMPRRADLLFLDLFSDQLFNFRPFEVVRTATRLLRPGAVVVPQQVSLEGALADFRRWQRIVPGQVAAFDLGPLIDLASTRLRLDPADPDLLLRSPAQAMVSATLPDQLPTHDGVAERLLVSDGGRVNGVAIWLRLQLAPGYVLEAKPGQAPRGFYAQPRFFPFREPFDTQPGQQCMIRFAWEDESISVRLIGQPR